MKVVVQGSGPGGLASALALARTGHTVDVLERDAIEEHSPDAAFDRERRGIPHFRQPHAFTPRTRREMLPPSARMCTSSCSAR